VTFGTGKYLESGPTDVADDSVQSFYAVWDIPGVDMAHGTEADPRASLLEQQILAETLHTVGVSEIRVTSNTGVNWAPDPTDPGDGEHLGWYMDLCVSPCGLDQQLGERVVQPPLIRGDRVIFVTLIPNDNPCTAGGESWVMEVELGDGSRLDDLTPFDFTGDAIFDLDDVIELDLDPEIAESETYYGSGIRKPDTGIYSAPAAMVIPGQEEKKYVSTSTGEIIDINESLGLSRVRPWREIR
jgi:type IV pilus assembly protein PilY1